MMVQRVMHCHKLPQRFEFLHDVVWFLYDFQLVHVILYCNYMIDDNDYENDDTNDNNGQTDARYDKDININDDNEIWDLESEFGILTWILGSGI